MSSNCHRRHDKIPLLKFQQMKRSECRIDIDIRINACRYCEVDLQKCTKYVKMHNAPGKDWLHVVNGDCCFAKIRSTCNTLVRFLLQTVWCQPIMRNVTEATAGSSQRDTSIWRIISIRQAVLIKWDIKNNLLFAHNRLLLEGKYPNRRFFIHWLPSYSFNTLTPSEVFTSEIIMARV